MELEEKVNKLYEVVVELQEAMKILFQIVEGKEDER